MKMTIGKKIASGYVLIVLISAMIGFFGYTGVEMMNRQGADMYENFLVSTEQLRNAQISIYKCFQWQKSHIISDSPELKKEAEKKIDHFKKQAYSSLEKLKHRSTEKNRAQIKQLIQQLDKMFLLNLKIIEFSNDYSVEDANMISSGDFMKEFQKVDKITLALLKMNTDEAGIKYESNKKIAKETSIWLLIAIFISALVSLIFGWILSTGISRLLKNLVKDLSNSSKELGAASEQFTKNSQQLAEGATQQAANQVETSSAIEQVASQSKENVDSASSAASSMKAVADMVRITAENAKTASNYSDDVRNSADDGVQAMESIADSMREIHEGSDKITDIIEVINEITHQTKMLATNAAIEAARAGEHGKGFAIVADEVSKLAESSRKAAKEISSLIKNSVSKAQNGYEIAVKGEQVLQDILTKSMKASKLVNEISSSASEESEQVAAVEKLVEMIMGASTEQAEAVFQISRIVQEMDQITQSNAANAEETASASEQLYLQSDNLRQLIDKISGHLGIQENNEIKKEEEKDFYPEKEMLPSSSLLSPVRVEQRNSPSFAGVIDDFHEF